MLISKKTLEELRELINEKTEYRTGPQLVNFFNQLGFCDVYQQGFPSRKTYTDERLEIINGKPEMDKCIRLLFDPANFITRFTELDQCINEFNQYLSFDGWKVIRRNKEVSFEKVRDYNVDQHIQKESASSEEEFLKRQYSLNIDNLDIESGLLPVIKERIDEIERCMSSNIPLAAIFLSGSTLEGLLLDKAVHNQKTYNCSPSAPKNRENKVLPIHEWKLNSLIDVSCKEGFIGEDVRKFSHALRDFRNYIHPYEQMVHNFQPEIHTAMICFQVLKAALWQLSNSNNK